MPTTHTGSMDVPGLVKDIHRRIIEAVDDAVDDTTHLGVKMAKRMAPRRKVTELERRAKRRKLSRAEILRLPGFASGGARGQGGRFAGKLPVLFTTTRQAQQTLDAPEVEDVDGQFRLKGRVPGEKFPSGDETFLTGRGIAELREAGRHEPQLIEGHSSVDLRSGKIVTKPDRLIPGTSAVYTQRVKYQQRGRIKENARTTLGGRLRAEIYGRMSSNVRGKITYHIVSPTPYARYVELPTSRTAEQPYLRPTLKALRSPFKRRVMESLKAAGLNPHPI